MIKILGKMYTVKRERTNPLWGAYCGLTEGLKQLITIQDDLPKDTFMETYLHEIIHAIDFAMCTKLTEKQVEGLSNGLYAFCVDNGIKLDILEQTIDE